MGTLQVFVSEISTRKSSLWDRYFGGDDLPAESEDSSLHPSSPDPESEDAMLERLTICQVANATVHDDAEMADTSLPASPVTKRLHDYTERLDFQRLDSLTICQVARKVKDDAPSVASAITVDHRYSIIEV